MELNENIDSAVQVVEKKHLVSSFDGSSSKMTLKSEHNDEQ